MTEWKSKTYHALINEWIPKMIMVMIPFLGVVWLGPLIQNSFLDTNNYNREKVELWKNYTKNFTQYRMAIWNMHVSYKTTGKCTPNQQQYLEPLVASGFNLDKFFGRGTQIRNNQVLNYIQHTTITCKNAETVAKYLLKKQKEIIDPMWSQVFPQYRIQDK